MSKAQPYEGAIGCCDDCGAENALIYPSVAGWMCVSCVLEEENDGYTQLHLDVALGVLAAEHKRAEQAKAEMAEQQKELALLRELRTDVERWREDGGDARDVGYILDTLDKLEESHPQTSEEG